MQIQFTKMQGLGNDFVVVDAMSQDLELSTRLVKFLGDRHFGVGFDQMLIVEAPSRPNMDFRYRIFNATGEEVEHCGNGARCFAKYVTEKKLTHKAVIDVETQNGDIQLQITDSGLVRVDMGQPKFEPKLVPLATDQEQATYQLDLPGFGEVSFSALSVGNPHAVLVVDDVETFDVETVGPILESHEFFPNNINVGFIQIVNESEAKLRVYERGVGETIACGTGACAAMVAACRLGLLNSNAQLKLRGGVLDLSWQQGQSIIMTGPAETVFEGVIEWKAS